MKHIEDAVQEAIVSLGLDAEAIITRKAFLGLSDADINHLVRLHEALKGLEPDFVRRFHEYILQFPETRRFITDENVLAKLRQSQADYFNSLTTGDYGLNYIRHRLRVGLVHQRIGLETQWYLGAYSMYLVDLLPEIWHRLEQEPECFINSIQALIKIVMLDMGLAIDTYIHADRQAILAVKGYAEQLIAAIPDGLVVVNSDLTVVSANKAFLKCVGMEESLVDGQPLLSLISADGFREKLDEVWNSGIAQYDLPFEMGLTYETSRIPVLITLIGIHIPNENVETGMLVIVKNITEQMQLQQSLQESEASLLRAQEVAHIGSWRLDFIKGTLKWSPEVYRIFGLSQDTSTNYEVFLSCIHPDDLEVVVEAWRAAVKGNGYQIQHRILVDGATRWVEERAEIEFDYDGHPLTGVGTVQDITERIAAEKEIETLAFYDPLTGLPNRALFMDRLKHKISLAEWHGEKLSLLFLNLNRFKEINNTVGHNIGDQVLGLVAQRFRQAMRGEETLARLSGDEFAVIASVSGEEASHIGERIVLSLTDPIVINSQEFFISSSIGIAIFPEDGRSAAELFKHADIAMHLAKISGGYRYYSAEMGENLSRKLTIAKRLEAALSSGKLQLHYQPQVHFPRGQLYGAEALARWNDSELGIVSPSEFIPIAEERGLISALSEWSLYEACCQVYRWRNMSGRVAVNISAKQFENDNFIDQALLIAREAKIATSSIDLELTESSMMSNPERAIEIVHALASAGFSLSIDDFGTGYSSLAYLKRFPVNKLKIDISFVRDMLNDNNDHSIVSTIIAMAKSLGLETIAEGVENSKQSEALLSLGCHYMQGYYFGHPQSADEFEKNWLSGATFTD